MRIKKFISTLYPKSETEEILTKLGAADININRSITAMRLNEVNDIAKILHMDLPDLVEQVIKTVYGE